MGSQPNIASVLAQAIGQGIGTYSQATQQKSQEKKGNALQAYMLMLDQQKTQQGMVESQLRMDQMRKNMADIDEKLRVSQLTNVMTEQQRMDYETKKKIEERNAEIASTADAEIRKQKAIYGFLDSLGLNKAGNAPTSGGAGAGVNQATKLINPLVSLTNKNAEIAKGNASLIGKFKSDSTAAAGFDLPIPSRPDTTAHINIDSVLGGIAPFVVGDSLAGQMFPSMQPQAAPQIQGMSLIPSHGSAATTEANPSLTELEADYKAGKIDKANYLAWKAYLGGK